VFHDFQYARDALNLLDTPMTARGTVRQCDVVIPIAALEATPSA
jgi:hypothetical protein